MENVAVYVSLRWPEGIPEEQPVQHDVEVSDNH
jgi:hypothetical protein